MSSFNYICLEQGIYINYDSPFGKAPLKHPIKSLELNAKPLHNKSNQPTLNSLRKFTQIKTNHQMLKMNSKKSSRPMRLLRIQSKDKYMIQEPIKMVSILIKVELGITLVVLLKIPGIMSLQLKKNSGKTDGMDTKSQRLKLFTMKWPKHSKTLINNPFTQL